MAPRPTRTFEGRKGSMGVPCPNCMASQSIIFSTRPQNDNSNHRRRQCTNCGHRYTTYETLVHPKEKNYGLTQNLKTRIKKLEEIVHFLAKDLLK